MHFVGNLVDTDEVRGILDEQGGVEKEVVYQLLDCIEAKDEEIVDLKREYRNVVQAYCRLCDLLGEVWSFASEGRENLSI